VRSAAKHPQVGVKMNVLRLKDLPQDVLVLLSNDPKLSVSAKATSMLGGEDWFGGHDEDWFDPEPGA
jgi:hypothetical protein